MFGPGPLFELAVLNQFLDSKRLLDLWVRTRNQLIINGALTAVMPIVTKRLNNIGFVGRLL
jgi:hypothetical protein